MSDERYALDGWDTAKPGAVGTENFDVFADLDAAGTVTARRVFGPGFDEPVARLDPSGEVGWYGTDSQDSVRLIFDNTGTVTGSRDYTAFGAITAESGAGLDRYAYTAREWDAALGLQSNRQRMYDPATGRFTSEDPSGLSAGDVNLFRYAGNAVTVYTDPSGLDFRGWAQRFAHNLGQAGEGAWDAAGQFGLFWVDTAAFAGKWGMDGAFGTNYQYQPYSRFYQTLANTPADQLGDLVGQMARSQALGEANAWTNYLMTGDADPVNRWYGESWFNLLMLGMAAKRPAQAYGKGEVPCPTPKSAPGEPAVPGAVKPAAPIREPLTVRESLDLQDARNALGDPIHNAYTNPRAAIEQLAEWTGHIDSVVDDLVASGRPKTIVLGEGGQGSIRSFVNREPSKMTEFLEMRPNSLDYTAAAKAGTLTPAMEAETLQFNLLMVERLQQRGFTFKVIGVESSQSATSTWLRAELEVLERLGVKWEVIPKSQVEDVMKLPKWR